MTRGGFSRVASLIETARAEAARDGMDVALFDNGDWLQGTVLADLAAEDVTEGRPHALVQGMAQLGYDAIGLGNHDFDYGIDLLQQALATADCPVVCSNLERIAAEALPQVVDHAVVMAGPLRVGVVAAVPPQTALWNGVRVVGRLKFADIAEALADAVARVRAAGCDLVVALAHTGFGDGVWRRGQENALEHVRALDGIDAVFGGHTHLPFADGMSQQGAPVALPGPGGMHLAQIDLELEAGADGRWSVAGATACLRAATEDVAEHAAVSHCLTPLHRAARARMNEPCGQTDRRLHSYFSLIEGDAYLHLMAEAQYAAAMRTPGVFGDLPVLSAVAPGRFGGRGGPENYTDVPVGPVLRRHVSDLVLFPNALRAVVLNGAQLRRWLEMSASVFGVVMPGEKAAALLDADWPAHGFDTLFGLSYRLDLTRPAQFLVDGRLTGSQEARVVGLTYRGQPVGPEDRFAVLLTDYRLSGGGNVPGLARAEKLAVPGICLRDAVVAYLAQPGCAQYAPQPWSFEPVPGARAVFATGQAAAPLLAEISRFSPQALGLDADGFLRVSLAL